MIISPQCLVAACQMKLDFFVIHTIQQGGLKLINNELFLADPPTLQMDILDIKSNHLSLKSILLLITLPSKHQIFTIIRQCVLLRGDT